MWPCLPQRSICPYFQTPVSASCFEEGRGRLRNGLAMGHETTVERLLEGRPAGRLACEVREGFVRYLREAGVRTPRLVDVRTDGAKVVEVYERIEGTTATEQDAGPAGRALAELHAAARGFTSRAPGCKRDWLSADGDMARLEHIERQMQTYVPAPEMFAPMERVKGALRRSARALEEAELPKGMVHGSALAENALVDGEGNVWVTGFEHCHRAPLLMDLATAVMELGEEVVEGYEEVRGLREGERAALPEAVRRVTVHFGLERRESVEVIAERLG